MADIRVFETLKTQRYGNTVSLLSSVDSTNNYIKRLEKYLPDGHAAISEEQLSGRGRQGKSFFSPSQSGLYMSILVKDPEIVSDALFTAKISLAVCHAIDRLTGTGESGGVSVKWVNDIYFGGKKLCGILCERLLSESGAMYVIAGIGVNLVTDAASLPKELRGAVCSLFDITRTRYDAYVLASLILEEFERVFFEDAGTEDFLSEYKRRSCVIGHEISVIRGEEKIRAAALDICPDGALLVRYEDGFTAKLCGGEISIRVKNDRIS